MRKKFRNVDEYLNSFPKEVKSKLAELRRTIKKAAPGLTEKISYGIAGYFKDGYVIYFAGFKKHVSIYPASDAMMEKIKGLQKYRKSKGTLQFPLDKKLPLSLITKAVKFRMNIKVQEIEK